MTGYLNSSASHHVPSFFLVFYILLLGPGECFVIRCLVLVTNLLKEENICNM